MPPGESLTMSTPAAVRRQTIFAVVYLVAITAIMVLIGLFCVPVKGPNLAD